MATATLTVSDSIKGELKRFSWINWSEVAREEFIMKEEQLKRWDEVEKILSKSQLTQEQADKLADEINLAVSKRLMKFAKETK